MAFRASGVPVVLWLAWAAVAQAQSPPERAAIERFRGALAQVTDSTRLLQQERQLIAMARQARDSAFLHLELGFLALRLAEVTDNRSHYDDAASEFEWATELESDWPYAWYGLGLAELALGEHSIIAVENLRQILGKDFLSKATRAFGRAARADPAFANAVIDLAYAAMRQRVRPRLDMARDALRQAADTRAGANPVLQLARGRVEREAGDGDSALAAFGNYLALGGDSALGLLESARTLFYLRRPAEAAAAYYRGAGLAHSTEARTLYRSDLSWIASDAELAGIDSLSGERYRSELERFWENRDLSEGRLRGERLAEHYRRYFFALRHYRLVSRHRHYDITERYRSEQDLVDDRGIIYLRHGEPQRRATYNAVAVEPNESWQYLAHDGTSLIFHFVARDDVSDYKLVESLADAYGARMAITAAASGNASFTAGLFESRGEMDPLYQRLGAPGSHSNRGPALAEERSRGRDAITVGTTTDSYHLSFRNDLSPAVLPLVVSGTAAGGRLVIPFAVPGRALTPFAHGDATVYPLAVRVAADGADGTIHAVDTLRMFATGRPLRNNEQINGVVELDVPPGRYRLRVVLAQPDNETGSVIARDSVMVPAFSNGAISLSDVLVGRQGEGAQWIRQGDSVPVSATLVFPRASSIDLYFEIHGLAAGEPFRTRIEVQDTRRRGLFGLFGGRRTPVRLEFESAADGAVTRVRQTVNLGSADPGAYVLRVAAVARGDEHHTRDVSLTVTDPP